MARRKAPQNKDAGPAPENKEPFVEEAEDQTNEELVTEDDDEEQDDDDMLTAFTEKDAQLRRLLKAENNEWVGTIERLQLRRIADNIRAELSGNQEVDMGGTDDE